MKEYKRLIFTTQVVNSLALSLTIQFTPALTDLKGLTICICYLKISVIAIIGKKNISREQRIDSAISMSFGWTNFVSIICVLNGY